MLFADRTLSFSNVCLVEHCYSFAEGERFAKANDLLFLEASAKTGDYVEETMVTAAINVLERLNNGQFRPDDEVCGVCLCVCVHVCVHVCMYVYICVCVHVCMCV